MKLESNYMAQFYGIQHKIGEMLLPDERIEIQDTPFAFRFVLVIRGPGYGTRITVEVEDLKHEEDLLAWLKREIDKVRADWRKEGSR
jgi:hypothetical protein